MNLRNKLNLLMLSQAKQKKEPIYCEYIESVSPNVNRQYIDTGIKPNSDTTLVLTISDMAYNGDHVSNQYNVLYSADQRHGNTSRYGLFLSSPERISGQLHYGDDFKQLSATPPITGKHIFKQVNNELYIDNALVCVAPAQTFQCNNSLVIFGDTQYASWTPILAKLYSVQMYDKDNTLLVNLRPCLHPDTLEPCMYDTVKGEYHYNKGREPFKYKLGFTKLDYLESTGTQYVRPNYIFGSDNIKIRTKVNIKDILKSKAVFGWQGASTYCGTLLFRDTQKADVYPARINSQYIIGDNNIEFFRNDTEVKLNINGDISIDKSPFAFERNAEYFSIFGNTSRNNFVGIQAFVGSMYYFELYDNNILVRDYIPIKMNDGQIGLWDCIEGKFYANLGDEKFKGYLNGYQVGESIESTGTQYIKLGHNLNPKEAKRTLAMNVMWTDDFSERQAMLTNTSGYFEIRQSSGLYGLGSGVISDVKASTTSFDEIKFIQTPQMAGELFVNGKKLSERSIYGSGYDGDYIFALQYPPNKASLNCKCKMSSFQMYDKDDKLYFMFIPVQKDGFIGMIDTLTGKEYPNMGTGEFIFNN